MAYQSLWFDQNILYWQMFLARFVGMPCSFLEIGCFEGRATQWLLANILTHPDAKITVVDTFIGSPEFPQFGIDNRKIRSNFDENTKEFKDKITVIEGKSECIRTMELQQFDGIYVDGSHRCIDVLRDGVYAFDLLKPGGVIIFDDYNWDMGLGEKERPHQAIQSLISIWGGYYGSWKFWLDQAAFIKAVV